MWQQARWFGVLTVLALPTMAWSQSQAWRSKDEVAALAKRIDDHIAAAQRKAEVIAAPPADHGSFFRRIHLDLTGLVPALIDIKDYLDNRDPDKLWDWSERFLHDHTYGDSKNANDRKAPKTYGKHFAAVLRGHILNAANQQARPFLPSFELWLKKQLEENVGYDRMVRDLLKPGSEFFNNMMVRGGMATNEGSPAAFYLAAESKAENLAGSASRVFLGVKLECAQCHTHPFAKWTREEFWGFAAFFVGTQQQPNRFQPDGNFVGNPVASTVRQITIPGTDKVVKAKFLSGDEPKWKSDEPTRSVLADWLTSPKNPYFARATVDMIWSHFFGISLLEPILEPSDDAPITHPELLDIMAQKLIEHNFDLKFLIRAIVHTQAYQRSSGNHGPATKDDFVLFTRMPVRGLSPEQLYDSVIEAALGATGHDLNGNYLPVNDFAPRQGNNPRAEFLAKFANQDKRHESQTSILQALYLMNNRFLEDKIKNNESLDRIAASPMYATVQERISSLFLMSLSREPRPEEIQRLVPFVDAPGASRRQRLGDIFWALLNSAEFRLNH